MRFVPRSEFPKPGILASPRHRSAMDELKAYFRWLPEHRRSRRPPLDGVLLKDPTVHSALLQLFHRKCSYCEQGLAEGGHGLGIDHYRPLRHAAGNSRGEDKEAIDHYAWLAYEWNNLLLSCPACNAAKRNQFPTANGRAVPMTKWRQCDRLEKPLLLNPSVDKPSRHLAYSIEGECIALSLRGDVTIQMLALNRSELLLQRAAIFHELVAELRKVRFTVSPARRSRARNEITRALDPAAPFSGAVAAFLGRPFRRMKGSPIPLPGWSDLTHKGFSEFMANSDRDLYLEYIDELQRPVNSREWSLQTRRDIEMVERAVRQKHRFLIESHITSVRLIKFKGIDDLGLKLGRKGLLDHENAPATALLGENSCGKSSILQAVALALMPLRHVRSLPLNFRKGLVKREADAGATSVTARVILEFETGDRRMLTVDEAGNVSRDGEGDALVLGYGAHRMFGDEQDGVLNYTPQNRTRSLLFRNKTSPHPASWLRGQDEEGFEAVARAMREILSLDRNDEITRDLDGSIVVERGGEVVPVARLSDGYRSLFAMALDIMRSMVDTYGNLEEAKGYVLIDEIELHLHPRWKMRVVSALRSAMPGVQFIFTTHDPLCLRGLHDGEVHVLVREHAGPIRSMEGLPDVRTMRAEQLLTSEYFGLASTSDPEIAGELDAMAKSAPGVGRTPGTRSSALPIGDSTLEQVINEGVRRHLADVISQPGLDRNKVRQEAVEQVLGVLRAWRKARTL